MYVFTKSTDLLFLLGSLIAYYISSRAAANALDRGGASPGRQAVGFAVPVAVVAWVAAGAGQGQLAVAVLLATAVAALTLVMGLSLLTASAGAATPRGVWALALPAALLAWMAGFAGRMMWIMAAALLLEGLAIAAAWIAREESASPAAEAPAPGKRSGGAAVAFGGVQFLLAMALAAIGAWMTLQSSAYVTRQSPLVSHGLFAAAVVGPMLVLPMIGVGISQAQRGKLSVAMGAPVGVVLLILCLLLPVTAGVWWWFHSDRGLLGLPLGAWRIDNMALVVLGMLILCLSMRLCRPGRLLGGILVLAYVAYLTLSLRGAVGV